jgi:heparan-alpha-glucosaminide N-acetyltransferase
MVMIFVNYGGGKYWFFSHSVWNGITVADLVFPWFMWLMGVSFAVSLQAKLRRAVPRRQLVINVMRRSFILILLGVIINSNQNLQTIGSLRFPGVLQRIGITYFVVGILEITFTKRSEVEVRIFIRRSVAVVTSHLNFRTSPAFTTSPWRGPSGSL